jgi:hypothetical protein
MNMNNQEAAYLMLYAALKRAQNQPEYAKLQARAEALLGGFEATPEMIKFAEAVEELDKFGGI